eukprot:m.143885 g.143885  ORF g.143885 m.143885 type:complete len:122 (-) comp30342_c0_seq1:552-917(-)
MASPVKKGVVFKDKSGQEREKRQEKLIQTGRYDRNAIKMRIDVEEWLDTELRILYNCTEDGTDDSCMVEIDVDALLDEETEGSKTTLILNLLRNVPKNNQGNVKQFASDLIKKTSTLKRLK